MNIKAFLNRYTQRSITRDMTLAFVVTTAIVFLAIGASSYVYFPNNLQNELHAQASELADNLAEVLQIPLWNVNTTATIQAAQSYEQANGVVSVKVTDDGGRTLYETETETDISTVNTFVEERDVEFERSVVGHVEVTFTTVAVEASRRGILLVTIAALIPVLVIMSFVTQAIVSRFISQPLNSLAEGIDTIANGSYDFRLPSTRQQDIQYIAERANSMAGQIEQRDQELRELIGTLEIRVSERTRDLELAAEIGRRISQIQDIDTLLREATTSIRNRFQLYHVQIYLLDKDGQELRLLASAGAASAQLLAINHTLEVGPGSINGQAVYDQQPIIVSDTAVSPLFLAHPLLPETRSEAAVPLIVGQQVLGVLDLQSHHVGGLTMENLPAFETLAGQLAVTISNARLFTERQHAEAEMAKFKLGIEQAPSGIFLTDRNGIILYTNPAFTEMYGYTEAEAIGQTPRILKSGLTSPGAYSRFWGSLLAKEVITHEIINKTKDGRFIEVESSNSPIVNENGDVVGFLSVNTDVTERNAAAQKLARRVKELNCLNDIGRQVEIQPTIPEFLIWVTQRIPAAMPHEDACIAAITYGSEVYGNPTAMEQRRHMVEGLRVSGEQIGRLYIAYTDPDLQFADDDSAFIGGLGRRINSYVETQGLLKRLAQQATELQRVAEIGTTVAATLDPQQLLQTFVDLTKNQFELYHAHIYLLDKQTDFLELTAGAGSVGRKMVAERRQIFLRQQQSLVARAARTRQGVIVNDVRTISGFLPHPLLPETRAEMAVPMLVGEQLLGVLDLQSNQVNAFTTEDINIFTTLSTQVTVALQNAYQLEQTQATLQELTALQRAVTQQGWHTFMNTRKQTTQGFVAKERHVQPLGDQATTAGPAAHITTLKKAENTILNTVTVGETIVGGLGVTLELDRQLTEPETELLQAISQQVGQALERTRLAEQTQIALNETQQRTEELAVLNEMSQSLTAQTTIDGVLDIVYQYTSRLMDTTNFYIVLYDAALDEIEFALSATKGKIQRHTERRRAGQGITEYIIKHRKSLLMPNHVDQHLAALGIESYGSPSLSWLGAPLLFGEQVVGVIGLQSYTTPDLYTEQHLRLLTAVANQATIAIENTRFIEETSQRAQKEQMLREITTRVTTAADADAILRTAAQEIGRALGLETFVYLSMQDQDVKTHSQNGGTHD